ncbi:MAG: nitroreductase family protein [Spirochaetales bacterium]|nr:nitroreductase family protein [Spirochaetales bacterium]
MKITGIDTTKCSVCGICIRECVAGLYSLNGKEGVAYRDPNSWCTGCGHCVSACPENAITYSDREKAREYTDGAVSFEHAFDFILSKRSMRKYREKDIPKHDIDKILDVMRHAPSGHNEQPCEYVVVKRETIKKMLLDETIASLRLFRRLMKIHILLKPFVPRSLYRLLSDHSTLLGLEALIDQYEAGGDPIFYQAPVIVLVHVPDAGRMSYVDPAISVTYGMLAAHSLGLGSCWMGFTMMAVDRNRRVMRRLNISENRLIAGVMTLGYPVHRYYRLPVRREVRAVWFE